MHRVFETPANLPLQSSLSLRAITVLALLLHCAAALATSVAENIAGLTVEQSVASIAPPEDIAVFDLHDPELMDAWTAFLKTTPMLNGLPLPPSLQNRLANVVEIYRSLTPDDRPAFFVATYFDLLSDRLLTMARVDRSEILPMQVCPVFVSGADASVRTLLAEASGLPEELFVHAEGQSERYRYLFLQTEFSHCRFLATTMAAYDPRQATQAEGYDATPIANLSFEVGELSYTAALSTKKELRALLETVGDADAITAFRQEIVTYSTVDEAEVLTFIRLLSLLATDGKSGYAAIPVLLPLVSKRAEDGHLAATGSVRIADALALAYQARELFSRIVPFAILDTQDLLNAKLAVMRALAEGEDNTTPDERLLALLDQFVTGSDLLLATAPADERMPLTSD